MHQRATVVDQTVGSLMDADATRMLSISEKADTLFLRDRLTTTVQALPVPVPSDRFFSSRLTPHGVITLTYGRMVADRSLYEWRDGAFSVLDSHVGDTLAVRGHYAAWVSTDGNTPASSFLYRRDLETNQTITVDALGSAEPFLDHQIDVSESGTVTYLKPAGAAFQVCEA